MRNLIWQFSSVFLLFVGQTLFAGEPLAHSAVNQKSSPQTYKAEVSSPSDFLFEDQLARDQTLQRPLRLKQQRIDANQQRIFSVVRNDFEKTIGELFALVSCSDSPSERKKNSAWCKANETKLGQFVDRVINHDGFNWSPNNKALLERAILIDGTGSATALVLRTLPQHAVTEPLVKAFLDFLKRDESGYMVEETKLRILDAIDRPMTSENPHAVWATGLSLPIQPGYPWQIWEPVLKLTYSGNSKLAFAAHECIRRGPSPTIPKVMQEGLVSGSPGPGIHRPLTHDRGEATVAAKIKDPARAFEKARIPSTPEELAEYNKRLTALKEWLTHLRERHEKSSLPVSSHYEDELSSRANAVMHHPLFDWSTGVKGLLRRAIEEDPAGFATSDILAQTPQEQMSPGMVHAALAFLGRESNDTFSQIHKTKRLILDGINNSEPFQYQYVSEIRIPLAPDSSPENWDPIIRLLTKGKQDFHSPAVRTLVRTGFAVNPFASE